MNFNEDLKNLWDQYILIQEQLLKKKCEPISINSNTIDIKGNQMSVEIDETSRMNKLTNIFTNELHIEPSDIQQNEILIDKNIWNNFTDIHLERIKKELASCYIETSLIPSINARIDYGRNLNMGENELTLSEIRKKDELLKSGTICTGQVEDTIACIATVNVRLEEYFKYLFGTDHFYQITKEHSTEGDSKEKTVHDVIEYRNHYIPEDTINRFQRTIGLCLNEYRIEFKIDNKRAVDIMRWVCDYYNPSQKAFVFKRRFDLNEKFTDDTLTEIQHNIRLFLHEAEHYCSKEEISIETSFRYHVNYQKTVQHIFSAVNEYVHQHSNMMSFKMNTGSLGIDFNWRTDNIEEIISSIEQSIPFIHIKTYGDDHRYKCKFKTMMYGAEDLKNKLSSRFVDISINNDEKNHCIDICLPCHSIEYYDVERNALKKELYNLYDTCEIHIDECEKNKVALHIKRNDDSMIEDLEDKLRELRKADFGVEIGERIIPFGKLISFNYPTLYFDIDLNEEVEEIVKNYLVENRVKDVVPILTGDIEKISRLKNTFTMASNGKNLLNNNLRNFIFDSSYATPIQDIEYILREDGGPYKELCDNLINNKINESQKHAILKCMFAKDLALIQGPPGSGKSTAIAELIWQLVRNGFKSGNKPERILLTSETNLAVDNAVSRIMNTKTNLVKPIRFGDEDRLESEGLQFSYHLMKKWVEKGEDALMSENEDTEDTVSQQNFTLSNWLSNISVRSFAFSSGDEIAEKWKNILNHPSREIRQCVFNRYIENANVIGATCSSIGDKRADGSGYTQFYKNYIDIFPQKGWSTKIEFTTVIQDESSKATPAELVLPFVYGHKAIVIGDHRQLPPMLDKEEMEDSLQEALATAKTKEDQDNIVHLQQFLKTQYKKIEESHFQRLYENIDSSLKETFNLQYRMHPDINDVIKQFYLDDGGLNCGLVVPKDLGVNDTDIKNGASRFHGLNIEPIIDSDTHVLFINSTSPEMIDGTSRVNHGEIKIIEKILDLFEESDSFWKYQSRFDNDEDKQIGIISFYGKQIKLIRSLANQHKQIPIRVSTVDKFQGMERNIIIVSMVRSNIIQAYEDEQPNYSRFENFGYPQQVSLGFAQSPNRLNVALSRAKRLIIIIGNERLFSQNPIYENLFQVIKSNPNNKVINQEELC